MDLGLMGLGQIDPQTVPSIALVVYDENGYSYRADNGAYLSVCYDETSQAYDCSSGARILNIDRRFFDSQKKPGSSLTAYLPYIIGGGVLLLLLAGGKR